MNKITELLMHHRNAFTLARPHPRFSRTTRKVKIRAFHSLVAPHDTDFVFYPASTSYEKARETGNYVYISAQDVREIGTYDGQGGISFGVHECWADCPCPLIINL